MNLSPTSIHNKRGAPTWDAALVYERAPFLRKRLSAGARGTVPSPYSMGTVMVTGSAAMTTRKRSRKPPTSTPASDAALIQ